MEKMQKIVTNRGYGGFSLSHEAMLRYFEIAGITVFPEHDGQFWLYWTVPEAERVEMPGVPEWAELPLEERRRLNETYDRQCYSCYHEFKRNDPALIRVVEEFQATGRDPGGRHATIRITEIPEDVGDNWHIEEYDGCEHVAENHRTW